MEVKPEYKLSEVDVVPKDWDIKALFEVAPLQRGFDLPSREIKNGTFPVVYSNGIENYHHVSMVSGPGVITGRSGTLGKVHFIESDYWPHNTTLWVTKFNKNYPKYIYYLYKFIGFNRFASGTGVPTLNRNDAHSFKVALPKSINEQKKIAETLTDVDNLLESIDHILIKKQNLKKAIIHGLITGDMRLSGFKKPWVKKKIGEAYNYVDGVRTNGGDQGYIEIGDIDVQHKSYDLSQKGKLSVPGAVKVPANTLLISTVRPTRGAIAITQSSLHVSSAFCRLRLTNKFLFYLVCHPNFLKYLDENSIGGTYPICRDDTILNYEAFIPNDLDEQIAISKILSDMDDEITALQFRYDKIKNLKQGMTQELLSGKTRLIKSDGIHA